MEKKLIGSKEQLTFRQDMQSELAALLSWWMQHMMDKRGGFYGRMDSPHQLQVQADRGLVLNARILWTFSAAARQCNNTTYANTAHHAWQYLHRCFTDAAHGGLYWMLNHEGKIVQDKKQIYAQAFAIYAYAEYHRLSGEKEALQEAIQLFDLIEQHSLDKQQGGYLEAFSREWELLEDVRLSDKDANEAKTMNTHLHILEAYTNLFRVHPTTELTKALRHLIRLFLDRFIDPVHHHLQLFFSQDWQPRSTAISYGHDIECSWLLLEAAEALGEEKLLAEVRERSLQMAVATLSNGMDKDGALLYEVHPDGSVDDDKHWWPQAEAIIGFWSAWQLSGEAIHQQAALRCWDFVRQYIRDREHGEWHWGVTAGGGKLIADQYKAGPWKAPYHNVRMCLELLDRL
ncbi:MAG: AGE family epimerase/isomerase [Bacteroidota bacterium]